MSTQDLDIVKMVQSGDKRAFDLLVQKYQFRIINLVSRYVKDPADALDITQESFMKAYDALEKFRGDSAFYTWLYRIAINTAKNHVLGQKRVMVDMDIENMTIDQMLYKHPEKDFTTPEKMMICQELESALLDVIAHLPYDLKTAITLREMDGLTYEEIAGVMACPIGTVRSRIFRAREAIERRIGPHVSRIEN